MDPEIGLYQRLVQYRSRVRRVEIGWNAADGGPRMDVNLLGTGGEILAHWNDRAIIASGGHSNTELLEEVMTAGLGVRKIHLGNFGANFANFDLA